MRRNGRIVSAFVMAACALTCTASFAGTKVKIIYTAAPPYLASFVAQDQGFFAKNGLDVVLELVANGSVITQSLVSGGAEIGGPTATVLLQADEAGLDMVALAAAEKFPTPYRLGLLAREGSNVTSPASLAGKTIGVPGLNGVIDVMVRKFLAANGVDEKKVKRIELAFAQMGDALKSGRVDVVATADPFFSRIVDFQARVPRWRVRRCCAGWYGRCCVRCNPQVDGRPCRRRQGFSSIIERGHRIHPRADCTTTQCDRALPSTRSYRLRSLAPWSIRPPSSRILRRKISSSGSMLPKSRA